MVDLAALGTLGPDALKGLLQPRDIGVPQEMEAFWHLLSRVREKGGMRLSESPCGRGVELLALLVLLMVALGG